MKQGRTLSDLAAELERQAGSKRDFVADTRRLEFRIPEYDDDQPNGDDFHLAFTAGDSEMSLPINPLCHPNMSMMPTTNRSITSPGPKIPMPEYGASRR